MSVRQCSCAAPAPGEPEGVVDGSPAMTVVVCLVEELRSVMIVGSFVGRKIRLRLLSFRKSELGYCRLVSEGSRIGIIFTRGVPVRHQADCFSVKGLLLQMDQP